jgi:hypothetical protein
MAGVAGRFDERIDVFASGSEEIQRRPHWRRAPPRAQGVVSISSTSTLATCPLRCDDSYENLS